VIEQAAATARATRVPVTDPEARRAESAPTKTAGEENFPVGSWLLPAHLRVHVACYYAFARAADDIADDPRRTPEEKILALDRLDAVLSGAAPRTADEHKAARARESLFETGVPLRDAGDLLIAFRQDAWKRRYRDWDALIGYCVNSANPVGRYLLDLHGEDPRTHGPSNALCTALQILNHLQDCRKDYLALNRVYLPTAWFDEFAVAVEDLAAPHASPGMRALLDRALDGVDALNDEARALYGRIRDRRLRAEAAVIVVIAERLAAKLRRADPLAGRVVLSKKEKLACVIGGLARAWG